MSETPSFQSVTMYDPVGLYVLIQLSSWKIWQPGLWQSITVAPTETLTVAEFKALVPSYDVSKLGCTPAIPIGSYDLQRDVWTFPPAPANYFP